jgi:hypothetical protein
LTTGLVQGVCHAFFSSKNGGGKGAWGDILTQNVGFWVTGWQVELGLVMFKKLLRHLGLLSFEEESLVILAQKCQVYFLNDT